MEEDDPLWWERRLWPLWLKKTTTTTKLAFEEPECVSVSRRPLGRQHVRRESLCKLLLRLSCFSSEDKSVAPVWEQFSLIPAKGSDFPVPLDVAPPFHPSPPTPPKKYVFFSVIVSQNWNFLDFINSDYDETDRFSHSSFDLQLLQRHASSKKTKQTNICI